MSDIKLESEYSDLDKFSRYGDIYYYKKNENIRHNPYGPAFICRDGSKIYIINSKYHRLDGPAVIYLNGKEVYYINDKQLSKEEFEVHPERLKFIGKEHLACLG